jgi:hypothetical protein
MPPLRPRIRRIAEHLQWEAWPQNSAERAEHIAAATGTDTTRPDDPSVRKGYGSPIWPYRQTSAATPQVPTNMAQIT